MKIFLTLATFMILSVTIVFAQSHRVNRGEAQPKKAKVSRNLHQSVKPAMYFNDAKTVINEFPYHESFENGLGDWTLVDADNDGFNWMLISEYGLDGEYVHSGEECIVSMSYDNDSGDVLTPDNWLIS